jgi:hypothetical protein
MNIIALFLISTAGINSLLLPFSPAGVTTGFASSKGAEAILYNPANFEAGDDISCYCFYNNLFLSMKSYSLALTKRIKLYNFGLAITNFDYGDIELRPNYPTEDTVANFSANDLSFILGGKLKLSPEGNLGINVKYITENIYIYSGNGIAIDLALSYHHKNFGISFGGTNLGSKITLNNEDVNLPARLSLGLFYNWGKVIPAGEFHYLINNQAFEFALGMGFSFSQQIKLYTAVNYRDELYPGLGLKIKLDKIELRYATASYIRDLGLIHLMGIGLGF